MTSAARAAASRYASVASGYKDHWAPVLASLARPIVEELRARKPNVIVDLGCGPGEIAGIFARDGARVIGIDPTFEMISRASGAVARACGDAMKAPLRSAIADAVISTFVLQHLPHPGRALAEAARILAPGGTIATATWGIEQDENGPRDRIVQRALEDVDAPPAPALKTWHRLVQRPPQVRRYARSAGFRAARGWSERAEFQWTPETFLAWTTASGGHARRIAKLADDARAPLIERLRAELETLPAAAFLWRPEIVYLIATR